MIQVQMSNSDINPIDVVPFDALSRGIIACWCIPGRSNFDSKTNIGNICDVISSKEIMKLPMYSNVINNTDSAADLPDYHIAKGSLFNDGSYGFRGDTICFDDTDVADMSDVQQHRAFLRVNTKTGVVYTVRKTSIATQNGLMDYYMFRAFRPQGGRLYLLSNWCISTVSDLSSFDGIVPYVSTFRDVQRINPGAILFDKGNGQGAVSHHAFCDKNGTKIYIDYVKRPDGEYCVSGIQKYQDGNNLLPYLLPIDRQLIDPSYVPSSDEKPGYAIM